MYYAIALNLQYKWEHKYFLSGFSQEVNPAVSVNSLAILTLGDRGAAKGKMGEGDNVE